MKLRFSPKWFWITRGIGAFTALYELLLDQGSSERGTIILAAFGIMGFEWVAKKEKEFSAQEKKNE